MILSQMLKDQNEAGVSGQAKEMSKSDVQHIPVMCKEIIEYLNLKEGAIAADFTLGIAGHAREIVERIGPKGHFIGVDRDGHSLKIAGEKLKEFKGKRDLIQSDYRAIDDIFQKTQVDEVDAMLFDLGISSYQLNNSERGFSIRSEGPLDMRMDQRSYISAYDLVNSLSQKEISEVLKNFGQERWHHRIAQHLIRHRALRPIESTKELSDLIINAVPHYYRKQKIHPATRTFQAIRIAVNRELEALTVAMDKCFEYLKVGGRICVISFHSLEDKIVKERFRELSKNERIRLITKKPLRPTEEEVEFNPRSRSARLRVAERIA